MRSSILSWRTWVTIGLLCGASHRIEAQTLESVTLIPESTESTRDRFTSKQRETVSQWLERAVPECPVDLRSAVVDATLLELRDRRPLLLDQLAEISTLPPEMLSIFLAQTARQMQVAPDAPERVQLARRRLEVVARLEGDKAPVASAEEVGEWLDRIKVRSDLYHRRLLDGKIEDDHLILLLSSARTSTSQEAPKPAAPVEKTLSALDILGEFSRRNQQGAAWQRLTAYAIHAKLITADGSEQQIVLTKLRPNRFRLAVLAEGYSQYLLAGDGQNFWQRSTTSPLTFVTPESLGTRQYLGEFENPLFRPDEYQIERAPDGDIGGRPVLRLTVKRKAGSGYVTCIDRETYREIAREIDDGSVVRYDDFREVAGVTFPFREMVTDVRGRKGVLQIDSITANPGLVPAFFQAPPRNGLDFFKLERLWAGAPESRKEP